jgi:hypothetical protein
MDQRRICPQEKNSRNGSPLLQHSEVHRARSTCKENPYVPLIFAPPSSVTAREGLAAGGVIAPNSTPFPRGGRRHSGGQWHSRRILRACCMRAGVTLIGVGGWVADTDEGHASSLAVFKKKQREKRSKNEPTSSLGDVDAGMSPPYVNPVLV